VRGRRTEELTAAMPRFFRFCLGRSDWRRGGGETPHEEEEESVWTV
jgi:hypothetical protein